MWRHLAAAHWEKTSGQPNTIVKPKAYLGSLLGNPNVDIWGPLNPKPNNKVKKIIVYLKEHTLEIKCFLLYEGG